MKITLRRTILVTLLAIVFIIAFGWVIMMQNHATLVKNNAEKDAFKLEEFSHTLKDIKSSWKNLEGRIKERYTVDTALSAMALRSVIGKSGDDAVGLYSNGAVIKVSDGRITSPDDLDKRLELTADMFEGKTGLFTSPNTPETLVVYSSILAPYYYVEWYEGINLQQQIEETIDIPGILQKSEATYDVYALCAAEDPDSETGERILYSNEVFTDLDESFSEKEKTSVSIETTEEENAYETGSLTLQNGTFRYIKSAVPEINGYLVLLSVQPNLYVKALGQASYMYSTLILFLAALLTAGFKLYHFIEKNDLTPAMEKQYHPTSVRRFATLCGVIGAIMIFLSGMMIYALTDLYDHTVKGKERLRMLDESLGMYIDRYTANAERFNEIYLDYGIHIAEALDTWPELREKQVLESLAESISASSITLYDADGNETISSGDLIDLSLSRTPGTASYDFRRILNGARSVIHDKEINEVTGEDEIKIGIRLQDESDEAKYGVLILTVDPSSWGSVLQDMNQSVLDNLSGQDAALCIVDSATGEILASSSSGQAGMDITELGLKEGDLKGSLIKNIETDNGSFFVTSAVLENFYQDEGTEGIVGESENSREILSYYIAADKSSAGGMLASSGLGCLLFLVIYGILAKLVLGNYTEEFFEQNKSISRSSRKTSDGWAGIRNSLSTIRPEKAGLVVMEIIIGLYLTQQIPIANFKTKLSRNSVYYYLTSGSWEKGLNLFALAGIMLLLGEIILTVIVIKVVLFVISSFVGSKGKTICRLLRSLSVYVLLFTFLIIGATYIGISMAAIIAFIGTLGISLSLGAQHFISDIIAGLTIVFEGTFHVGDIVDLRAGYSLCHGEVLEIGLRFTRLQDRNGNIVTLNNRDISVVSNMTQLNSLCNCEITISSDYSIKDIEEMLQRELPKVGEKDQRILVGPDYNGISALGGGQMTLTVTAECSEKDLAEVQQVVNRALQEIFTRNGYQI